MVHWVDPAGILSEILSSGFSKIFMGKGNFHDHVTVPALSGSFLVEGQDEVAAIRFSSASLPDLKVRTRKRGITFHSNLSSPAWPKTG